MAGLRFKTWRMRAGEWFEGSYVFATDDARADFQKAFTETAAESPGSRLVGSAPSSSRRATSSPSPRAGKASGRPRATEAVPRGAISRPLTLDRPRPAASRQPHQ